METLGYLLDSLGFLWTRSTLDRSVEANTFWEDDVESTVHDLNKVFIHLLAYYLR